MDDEKGERGEREQYLRTKKEKEGAKKKGKEEYNEVKRKTQETQ